jgi:hypothetical protein
MPEARRRQSGASDRRCVSGRDYQMKSNDVFRPSSGMRNRFSFPTGRRFIWRVNSRSLLASGSTAGCRNNSSAAFLVRPLLPRFIFCRTHSTAPHSYLCTNRGLAFRIYHSALASARSARMSAYVISHRSSLACLGWKAQRTRRWPLLSSSPLHLAPRTRWGTGPGDRSSRGNGMHV